MIDPAQQALDLTGNKISDWNQIRQLSRMTALTSLNVSSNELGDLAQPLTTGALHQLAFDDAFANGGFMRLRFMLLRFCSEALYR